MMGLKIAFPITEAGREMLLEAVSVLHAKRYDMGNYGIDNAIAELLSYLPEVQLLGSDDQTVVINGFEYDFVRRKLKRPLLDAMSRAARFEHPHACELTCLMVRYRRALET